MKKILKFLISFFIGIFIFWLVMKMVGWGKIGEALVLFSGFEGLIIILLTFTTAIIGVLQWKLILQSQGSNIPTKELGKLWLVGFMMSYLTPCTLLGGEALQVYLLKKRFNLNWEKSAASIIIDRILSGTFFLMFLIAGILAFCFYGHFPSDIMLWFIILVIGGLFGLLLLFYFKALNKESVLEWFLHFLGIKKEKIKNNKNGKIVFSTEKEVIRFFSPKKTAFWKSLGLSFLRYFLLFFRVSLLIFFLKGGIEISRTLAIYGLANFALLLPLPAALGSLEAAGAFSFNALGLGAGEGTIFAITLRSADLFLCLIGFIFGIKFGLNLAERKILEFIDRLKA
jgi:uncharacterized protein (TIRG00374 family)